jgi:2',3'-cyclic-nucleotide 2'-phosphodiesterase (5'-nucleotidase family)
MRSQLIPYAVGGALATLLLGCHASSAPAPLPVAGPVTSDSHFTLLQTTDLHDHADGEGPLSAGVPGPLGSYARIAAYVNAIRQTAAADAPVVLVDSGDWTMGSIYDFSIFQKPIATYFLDTLRYDCTTLGNREFDYGSKGLVALLSASRTGFGFATPIVASNLVLNGDPYLTPLFGTSILPTYVETLGTGLKIGYIGLMGKAAATASTNAAPVTFTDYGSDYSAIQALVTGLRTTQGCNVVIALSHAGTDPGSGGYTGEDVNLAQHVTGIDVIASGHTHNPFGADGNASHPVSNGSWTTQIICAGAYTSNVSRLDLTYHVAADNTTVDAASNLAMTDANLATVPGSETLDPAAEALVAQEDATLNVSLSPLFRQFFSDYSGASLSLGLYHPVGSANQDMVSNVANPVPNPNGLGNLCADALRAVPNGIIASALMTAGWNGVANSPSLATATAALAAQGYDTTPYTAALVPTGVIVDQIKGGAPVTFANAYDVMCLGISPDNTQVTQVGYPLMSAYLTYPDLQKLCGLQLLAQANLAPPAVYPNLSGLSYALDPAGSYTFFKYASAAAMLQATTLKAEAGSTQAAAALAAVAGLASDPTGATYLAALPGNPYLAALTALNDPAGTLTQAQTTANLTVLATVNACAQADAGNGTSTLSALLFTQAVAAIGPLSAFAAGDPACEGAAAALALNQRYRVAGDLGTMFLLNEIQNQFGANLTPYAGPTGVANLSQTNLTQALANRINLAGAQPSIQELKPWMALILFLTAPASQGGFFTAGAIPADYLSDASYTDFASCGAAVTIRNGNYPLASIQQLMATLAALAADS